MSTSTNLARRPFRNERLPWVLALVIFLSAVAISVGHARLLSRLLAGDEANTVRLVRADEARIAELETAIPKEPPLKLEAAELARLRALKQLVDRRVFPWRRLLAELEDTLSDEVRLTRITPTPKQGIGGMLIELTGEARSKDAAFSLAEALDASPAFSNAVLGSLSETEKVTEFVLEVQFDSVNPQRPLPSGLAPTNSSPGLSPAGSPAKPVEGRIP
jgi:Tfp pilus assembly protein PilN